LVDISIDLALDTLSKPHIIYFQPLIGTRYCYKDTIWHDYGIIDSQAIGGSLSIDPMNRLHIVYKFYDYDSQLRIEGIKYANGTFVGIKEEKAQKPKGISSKLEVYPNPFKNRLEIRYEIPDVRFRKVNKPISPISYPISVGLKIYDVTGRLVKQFNRLSATHYGGIQQFKRIIWYGDDDSGKQVPNGVYFIKLETLEHSEIKKIIRLK